MDKKGGNSNGSERIELMEEVLELIPVQQITALVADREFISKQWFKWLKEQKITCRVRIKNNAIIPNAKGKRAKVERLFGHVKQGYSETWNYTREIYGVELYVSAHRTDKGLLIVAATSKPQSSIPDYLKRWCIEVLFGNLKSRGFELKATHMTNLKKIDKLMALLAIAVEWCMFAGYHKHGDASDLPLLKHGRPEKSLFRLGLDAIREAIKTFRMLRKMGPLAELVNLLSPT